MTGIFRQAALRTDQVFSSVLRLLWMNLQRLFDLMQPVSRHRILTLALLAMCGPLMAASVQKWTDADGNVHYGDSPPPGSNNQAVRVNAAPPSSRPQPVYVPPDTHSPKPFDKAAHDAETDKRMAADKAAAAAREASNQAMRDKAVIDSCKMRRERYCNEGADAIRQKDYEHAMSQAADQQSAALAQGRVIPPSQRITPVNPCQWPQPCGTAKKK